ncbi:hypothetical protein [Yoonia sp. SDW83-1]|uniref:hypothetical protein n=1 Tax=Yoonia sp. SDW83-1 TaxID=3366945 RepID=UPI00398C67F7
MMRKETIPMGVWTNLATGPHSIFWALGRLRINIGDAQPSDDHTSLLITANGQPRSFTYSGSEAIWVMPIERPVEVHAVQIAASDLFLVDAAGNVLIDGGETS